MPRGGCLPARAKLWLCHAEPARGTRAPRGRPYRGSRCDGARCAHGCSARQAELERCFATSSARQHAYWLRFLVSRIEATRGVVPELEKRQIDAQLEYHAGFRDYTMNRCLRSEEASAGKTLRAAISAPVQPLPYGDPRWSTGGANPTASPPATTITAPQTATPATTISSPQPTTPVAGAGTLSWVAGPAIPPNAVIGGQGQGRDLQICRAKAPDGVHPGKVWAGTCRIGWGGREVPLNDFEVLVFTGAGSAPSKPTVTAGPSIPSAPSTPSTASTPLAPSAPPVALGSSVNIYYGKTIPMAAVPLVKVTANCYEVSYGGIKMSFLKSALGYRTDFPGNPVGLDYEARQLKPCD